MNTDKTSPGRICYVNGAFVPEADAKVSIFDRAFLFGDGVYEVSTVLDGRLVDNAAHLGRLRRSLRELSMTIPWSDQEIVAIQKELIARNQLQEGVVYLQITRGAADRNFTFPKDATPTLVMFTQGQNAVNAPAAINGMRVITRPDIRWDRCDIKTVQLLAACLAKQAAKEAGVDDAWFVDNGYVTEGSSNNAYILDREGVIITRQLGSEILPGITRKAVLSLAAELNLRVEERPFSVEEAKAAQEAFITSASTFVTPVTHIDGVAIGDGKPGPVAQRLRQRYLEFARATAE
jgi:D-alanine transaminase